MIIIRMYQRGSMALSAVGKIYITRSVSESSNLALLIKTAPYCTVVLTSF